MEGSSSSHALNEAMAWAGGHLGRLIRERDWSGTELGDPATWPVSLRTALQMVLGSQRPQAIWWGSDHVQFFNDRFRAQFGTLRRLEPFAPAASAWHDVWEAAGDRIAAVMERGEGWSSPIAIAGIDGQDGSGALTLLPLSGDDGEPAGFFCEWSPIVAGGATPASVDAKPAIESALEVRELRYRLVAEAAGDYIWDWDLATDRVSRNAGVQTLFGYSPDEIGNDLSWGISRIHPDDREGVMRQLGAAVAGAATSWAGEYRFQRADGTYADVATRGHIVRDASGKATRVIGAMRDLTESRKHEQALRDVEQQFRAVTMNAPVAIFIKDLDGRYALANPLAAQSLGRPRGVVGLTDYDLLPREAADELRTRDQEVIASGAAVEFEEVIPSGGADRHFLAVKFPLRNGAGETVGVGGVAVDVTDRKQAQQALRESERRLLLATQTGKVGVWAWDIEANRVSWSESLQGILGVTPGDLATAIESFESLVHVDDRERVRRALTSAIASDGPLELEFRAMRPSGEVMWLFSTGSVIRESGRAVRMLGATLDITDRKRSEEALRGSEERFRTLASHAPVGIFQTDLDGNNLFVNEGWREMAGMSPEEARGTGWMNAIHPDDRERVAATWEQSLAAGVPSAAEFRLLRPDGLVTWVQGNAVPLRDERGQSIGYIGTVADITARKQGEAALRNSELMYRAIGESIDYGIWVCDAEGRNIYCSESFLKLVGMTQAECSDLGWADLLHPDDVDQTVAAWKQCVQAGEAWDVEHRFRGVDGRWHPVLARGVPVRNELGAVIAWVGINLDISELKRVESELRESEARFRNMADNAPVLIWIHGIGGCQYVNREYMRFVGAELDDLQGMNWTRFIHPDEADAFVETYRQAFKRQQPVDAQIRMRRADGEYRWLNLNGTPRFRADGAFLGYVGCSVDVTEMKASENSLREADRRKDDFLAMLGHELRNPLAGIVTGAQVLAMLNLDEEAAEMQAVIARQAAQMSRIVDDLLDVSRIARGKLLLRRQSVNLRELLHDTVEDYRKSRSLDQCALVAEIPAEDVWIWADAARLAQAFSNLIHNSYKFGDGPNEITVILELTEGAEASVIIRDRGIGMSSETLQRVFEPFNQADNSLERSRGGLGLGLALTKGLIELHGGAIRADSRGLGEGAEFTIMLPTTKPPQAAGQAPVVSEFARQERILIIDDRRDAILPLNQMLKIDGHTVAIAQDGVSGVATAAEFQPRVVLCDIGLPGEMNGYAVCRALRAMPETASAYLVAVTGYGHDEAKREAKEAGFDYHVTKPVGKAVLRDVLANRPRL
ncbi:MAG: PAS domain S-box protein [Planctomycetaceae bacterium]|nr:PAS domain S-box protein [Planctomycetaceae bacterium]